MSELSGRPRSFTRRTLLGGAIGVGLVATAGPSLADPGADVVAARTRFFGAANVDPVTGAVRRDRVILSWFGCTSFAAALGGTVVLLDAWVPRGIHSGYVPTTVAQVGELRPDAIFIGHGHFDHAGDAGALAQVSGAVVFGTAEHCDQIQRQVDAPTFHTVALGDARSTPGETYHHSLGAIEVTAVRHVHSGPKPPDHSDAGSAPFFPVPDLRDAIANPPELCDLVALGSSLSAEEGGSLLYQFRIGGFILTWNDSAGPLAEAGPQVYDVLRGLPASDVHLGAIQGFNQPFNGLRDVRQYIEAIRPGVFVPSHHDNWLPGLTARGDTYQATLQGELDRIPADRRPALRFLSDPGDYLRPDVLTFPL
ncbi:MBL fold metallo-hydrolase [Nocardia mangyaensis]|uniref:MBL fold metallo-hydrolase n=1 Tax=Nocardia mangyaensis TaxID=2213200 RepID=UPI000A4E9183|nr:MBL fold metallo-hydrolase [Nocardia mangyaensis]